ncbi:RNA polymerase sigma factor region1.1 domain-containing protein [Kamptonema cortianum]|nr:RNA polymerase sigma factor region1.1 domain-containing protein [Kamptonema cortianum]
MATKTKKTVSKSVPKKGEKKAASAKPAPQKSAKAKPVKKAPTKPATPAPKAPVAESVKKVSTPAPADKKSKSIIPPPAPADATPVSALGTRYDRNEKIRELVRLAKEQGHLTYDDINDALPGGITSPDELDEVLVSLRALDIEIIDASDVDRVNVKPTGASEIEDDRDKVEEKLDILDDPVRMYLKQMGMVPLLTREQEVEISKRIEDAETEVQKRMYHYGFTAREHLNLAIRLIESKERYDRVIMDKKNRQPRQIHACAPEAHP